MQSVNDYISSHTQDRNKIQRLFCGIKELVYFKLNSVPSYRKSGPKMAAAQTGKTYISACIWKHHSKSKIYVFDHGPLLEYPKMFPLECALFMAYMFLLEHLLYPLKHWHISYAIAIKVTSSWSSIIRSVCLSVAHAVIIVPYSEVGLHSD